VVLGIGYASFIGFSAIWVAALNIKDKEKLIDQLGANNSAVALVSVCLLTCVIAPICEEFFFRGFFFTALRNWCGPWVAAAITGLVFGAIHAGSAPAGYLIPLAFFGFILCIVYWKTGSLYPCIVLHTLNNSIAFGITEHWDWQIPILVAASLATIVLALSSVARLAPAK
jgi:membrane protease YdiL (CAAX protease family)